MTTTELTALQERIEEIKESEETIKRRVATVVCNVKSITHHRSQAKDGNKWLPLPILIKGENLTEIQKANNKISELDGFRPDIYEIYDILDTVPVEDLEDWCYNLEVEFGIWVMGYSKWVEMDGEVSFEKCIQETISFVRSDAVVEGIAAYTGVSFFTMWEPLPFEVVAACSRDEHSWFALRDWVYNSLDQNWEDDTSNSKIAEEEGRYPYDGTYDQGYDPSLYETVFSITMMRVAFHKGLILGDPLNGENMTDSEVYSPNDDEPVPTFEGEGVLSFHPILVTLGIRKGEGSKDDRLEHLMETPSDWCEQPSPVQNV